MMLLFSSIYTIVDGFFVANFCGKVAFASITLLFPMFGILGSIGFMFGTGGAAIVAKFLGEKKSASANASFSAIVYTTIFCGILFTIGGEFFLTDIAILLGAEGEMLELGVRYSRIVLLSLPCFMLQFLFQDFFPVAEKPNFGLTVTIMAGCANMILDALLIVVWDMGLDGAAYATFVSECIGGLLPLAYFSFFRNGLLRLGKPLLSWKILLRASSNGISELLNNIAFPFLMIAFNFQLLRLVGEDGVAAFGVVLYVAYVFSALFLGYGVGSAPLVSYNFGAKRSSELKNIFRKSLVINAVVSLFLTILAYFLAGFIARLFITDDQNLCDLTTHALRINAPVFLVSWISLYGSAFFTALNNGLFSGCISFLRTFVFGCLMVWILPVFFGLEGVWLSFVFSETLAALVTFWLLQRTFKKGIFS